MAEALTSPTEQLSIPKEARQHYSEKEILLWNPDYDRWFENLSMGGYSPGAELIVQEGEEVKITGEVWNNEWWSDDPDSDVKVELWVEGTEVDHTRSDDEGKFTLYYRAPHPSAPETYFVRVHVDKTTNPGTEAATSEKWIVTVSPKGLPEEEKEKEEEKQGMMDKATQWAKNHPYITAGGVGLMAFVMMSRGD